MDVPERLRGKFKAGPEGLELEVACVVTGTQIVVEGLLGRRLFEDQLAIKSNDYPMEKLRAIPGFEEAKS